MTYPSRTNLNIEYVQIYCSRMCHILIQDWFFFGLMKYQLLIRRRILMRSICTKCKVFIYSIIIVKKFIEAGYDLYGHLYKIYVEMRLNLHAVGNALIVNILLKYIHLQCVMIYYYMFSNHCVM